MTVAFEGEWREAAMQSVHCAHNSRTALMMEKVRGRFPHASQMLINCERADLMRFLNAACQIEPLLTGSQLCSGAKDD